MPLLAGLVLAMTGCSMFDSSEPPPPAESAVVPTTDSEEDFPNLASVPDEAPVSTPRIDRDKLVQQLQSDRDHAAYLDEQLSAESVSVPAAAPPPSQAPESLALPTEDSPEDAAADVVDEEVVVIEPPVELPADLGEPAALIFFDGGSVAMTDHDRAILYDVARLQGKSKGGRLRLVGHANSNEAGADTDGDSIVSLDLALARANAVAEALIGYGVPASYLQTSTAPGAATYDISQSNGEAANRRVEIFLAQ
ncbi:MAG: OmpA family protein [Dongiaceae bacterium]